MSNFQLAGRLFGSPRGFFELLAAKPRYALPMWLTLLTSIGLTVWYYAKVDLEWIREISLNSGPGAARMTDAQREQAARFMTRGMLTAGAAGGGLFIVLLIHVVEAAWYKLLGRVTRVRQSFRQWFAFGWWTSAPHLVAVVPAALLIALSPTTQMAPGVIAPLSINELFLNLPLTHPGYQLALQVSVVHLVTLPLTIWGVRIWSGRSWGFSAVFSLLGPVLLFGGWAAFVASRT
jgi:hypothetical protein